MHIRTQATTIPTAPSILPLSRVHQRLLQQQLDMLEHSGQDITLLTQLADTLPRLRSSLSSAERQHIDELDRNADELTSAWQSLETLLERCIALGSISDPQLMNPTALGTMTQCLQDCAEACSEAALRLQTRVRLLEDAAS